MKSERVIMFLRIASQPNSLTNSINSNIVLHLIDIPKMHNLDLTPNQQDDVPTRIQHAKAFLQENPDEQPITAARIYALHPSTLYSSIKRPPTVGTKCGQNKILQDHHQHAIHQFIRSLLAYGIQPTHQLVYNSICSLRRAQNPNFKAPSPQWFTKW